MNDNKQNMQRKSQKGKILGALFLVLCFFAVYFTFIKQPAIRYIDVASDTQTEAETSYFETMKNTLFNSNHDNKILPTKDASKEASKRDLKCVDKNYATQLLFFSELKSNIENDKKMAELVAKINKLVITNKSLRDLVSQLQSSNYLHVMTLYNLQQDFRSKYQQLLLSVPQVEDNSGWFIKYLHKFVVIRKIGNRAKQDGGIDGQLARVETALTQGDLPRAIDLVRTLPDVQKTILAEWLIEVSTRLQIQTIVDSLYSLVASDQYQSDFIRVCRND